MVLKFNKDQKWKIKGDFFDFENEAEVPKNIPEEILNQMIEHDYVYDPDKPVEVDESLSLEDLEKSLQEALDADKKNDNLSEKEIVLAEFEKLGINADKRLGIDKLKEQLEEAKENIAKKALIVEELKTLGIEVDESLSLEDLEKSLQEAKLGKERNLLIDALISKGKDALGLEDKTTDELKAEFVIIAGKEFDDLTDEELAEIKTVAEEVEE